MDIPKLLRTCCTSEGAWVALTAVGIEVASSCVGVEAMPVSTILDVTLSAVAVGAGGSTSTVAGGTEMGSTLGATVLVVTDGVDVVVTVGVEVMDAVGNILVPALGFTTLTCPASAGWSALKHMLEVRIRYLCIELLP